MADTGLAGRIVLVTGANSGIGAATARAFAKEGASLARTIHEPLLRARSGRDLLRQSRRPLLDGVPDPDYVAADGLALHPAPISHSRDAVHE